MAKDIVQGEDPAFDSPYNKNKTKLPSNSCYRIAYNATVLETKMAE